MAVLLNDLFFSKTDSFSASLLSAFSFCITFIFRPIGALLIGWLGDSYGRKMTVTLTSFSMAICCITMFSLPTYQQIGIVAAWAVTICRIIQGMSSMGEKIGAEIYLTELIKSSKVYPAVQFLTIMSLLGTSGALIIADITTSLNYSWRYAFLFGAIIAVVGIFARTKLRETPDFADAKRELHKMCDDLKIDKHKLKQSAVYIEKVNMQLALALLFIQQTHPVWFYFCFVHCANILKHNLGYSAQQVIHQNFILSIVTLIVGLVILYLSDKVNALNFLKWRLYLFLLYIPFIPFLMNSVTNSFELLLIQSGIIVLAPCSSPAIPIFYKSFPVFKRYTSVCLIYALSRTLMYVLSSFGLVFLTAHYGNFAILILLILVFALYTWGLFQFIRHEAIKKQKEDKIKTEMLKDSSILSV